jgi:hypothetical protein
VPPSISAAIRWRSRAAMSGPRRSQPKILATSAVSSSAPIPAASLTSFTRARSSSLSCTWPIVRRQAAAGLRTTAPLPGSRRNSPSLITSACAMALSML